MEQVANYKAKQGGTVLITSISMTSIINWRCLRMAFER